MFGREEAFLDEPAKSYLGWFLEVCMLVTNLFMLVWGFKLVQATWQNTFTLGPGARLLAGIEHLVQEVDTSTPYEVTRRTINAVFAGFNGDFGAHGLQASVRRDDNSQFGAPTTGSVAYGYRFSPTWRARVSWGTAFHAPSFNDLYFPGFGNPGLAPER